MAVNPLAEAWVSAAATEFNDQEPVVNANRRVVMKIITVEDMGVWNGDPGWTDGVLEQGASRPTLWIPASSASSDYISGDRRAPFSELEASAARTVMMWGGFTERVNALTGTTPVELDWEDIAINAELGSWVEIGGDASWQFLDLAFAQPNETMSGLSVLLTGAASYHETTSLNGTLLRDEGFREWILPTMQSVPNFNSLGADPAQAIAQRGLSIADIAFLPESQWVTNLRGLGSPDEFVLAYPDYTFVMDFPVLLWDNANTGSDERAGAEQFADFLVSEAQQTRLIDFGLRPASGEITDTAQPFVDAQPYGVQLAPLLDNAVSAPSRSDVQSLLTWYGQNR